jgi:hypothetical protein
MSYDWRERGPEQAEIAWVKYLYRHPEASEREHEAILWAHRKGAQWAVATTSALSPAIAAMVSFVDWVHEHELERELVP